MNAVLANMLRRLHLRRPPTRGQVLRRAMRTAEGGRPVSSEDFWELFQEPPDELRRGMRGGALLRDGTLYGESGADENDWRL